MKSRITKSEAQAFRGRWETINAAERDELRTTSIAHKFQQLVALMASARALGWTGAPPSEEAQVRNRWKRLRQAYGG